MFPKDRPLKESEKDVEIHLKDIIEMLGGLCLKWVCPGLRGVPDRICLLPESIIFFVELKSEGKDLEPHQQRRARDLERLGHRCYMANTKAACNEIVKWEINNVGSKERSPYRSKY